MPEVPGCPTASVWILQYVGQQVFLAILTHNPLHRGKYVTYVPLCHVNVNWGRIANCLPLLCILKFHIKAAMDLRASESKFKVHYHDGVICPSCLHTACNSMYLMRAAAACTSKKQKYSIWNAPCMLQQLQITDRTSCLRVVSSVRFVLKWTWNVE